MMIEILQPELLRRADTVIIHAEISSFQREVLDILFPELNFTYIPRSSGDWLRFSALLYPSMVKNVDFHQVALSRVRERLLEAFAIDHKAPLSKTGIFVNRTYPTPRRRLANPKQVEPLLRRHGVLPQLNESLTARDQIAAFHQAPLVVGLHGAGLANLVFCRPGTPVVIIDYKWPSEMYALAASQGLRPIQLLAEQVIDQEFEKQNPTFQWRLRDFRPDPRQLDAAVCTAWLLARPLDAPVDSER